MMTKISAADEADAWCRQLGNFTPIAYRPIAAASTAEHPAARVFAERGSAAPARAGLHRQRGAAAAQFLLAALILAAMTWPLSGAAQQMPGGGMGGHGAHGGRGSRAADAPPKNPDAAVARPASPLRAMLEEMRKLRADMLLTSDQIGPWSAMEDALRECIELNRSRLPSAQTGTVIDAQLYVQDLADHERELADAEARFAAATKAAFATLNPRQRKSSQDRLAAAIANEQPAAMPTL